MFPLSRYLPCGWARNRCRCGGSASCQQVSAGRRSVSIAGSAVHGQCSLAQSRWLRRDKISSRAWHGQRFAVGQNLVCRAELRRGRCADKNCGLWTHLLALFISNTPLVSGGLVPPTNEKMRSNSASTHCCHAVFSPCLREEIIKLSLLSRKKSLSRENSARLHVLYPCMSSPLVLLNFGCQEETPY